MDKVNGKLTVWGTFQAPHAVRTVASLISGIAEHNIELFRRILVVVLATRLAFTRVYMCHCSVNRNWRSSKMA